MARFGFRVGRERQEGWSFSGAIGHLRFFFINGDWLREMTDMRCGLDRLAECVLSVIGEDTFRTYPGRFAAISP